MSANNPNQLAKPPSIAALIKKLYKEAEMIPPSGTNCITHLNELLGSYNLTVTEIPHLTSQTAMSFLLQKGAILDLVIHTSKDLLAGFLYVNSFYGSIFVEQNDMIVRRRFSVAHELGHYLLHFRPLIESGIASVEKGISELTEAFPAMNEDIEPDMLPQGKILLHSDLLQFLPTFDQMEHDANHFAVELLMPSDVLHELVVQYAPDFQGEDLVWRLSTEMLVSQAAMRWRLLDLKLISYSTEH
jgi:Zn-dependent peptidase ImmA (M78 family)